MPRSNDPLNKLLRDALHQQVKKITVVATSPRALPHITPGDLYRTESNWVQGKTILLIHKAEDGHESFLGIYIELLNPRASARRLIPAHGTVHGSVKNREIVKGDYWIHPQIPAPQPTSSRERREIRQRFNELMSQV